MWIPASSNWRECDCVVPTQLDGVCCNSVESNKFLMSFSLPKHWKRPNARLPWALLRSTQSRRLVMSWRGRAFQSATSSSKWIVTHSRLPADRVSFRWLRCQIDRAHVRLNWIEKYDVCQCVPERKLVLSYCMPATNMKTNGILLNNIPTK